MTRTHYFLGQQLFVSNVPQQFVGHVVALFMLHDPIETKNLFPGMPVTTVMIAMTNEQAATEAYNSVSGVKIGGQEVVIDQYSDDMPSAAVRAAYMKNKRRLRRSIEGRRITEEDEDEDVDDVGVTKDNQRPSSPPLIFGLHRPCPLPMDLSLDSPLNLDHLRSLYEPYRTNAPQEPSGSHHFTPPPPESHNPSTGVGDLNLLHPQPISPSRGPKFLLPGEPEFIKPPPGFAPAAAAPAPSTRALPSGQGKAYKIVRPPPGFENQQPRVISPSPAFVLPPYTGEDSARAKDVSDAPEPQQQEAYSTVPWNDTPVPTGTAYYEAMQAKGMGSKWSSDSSSAYSQGSATPRQRPVSPVESVKSVERDREKEVETYSWVDSAGEMRYRHERSCWMCREQRRKREQNWTERRERMEAWNGVSEIGEC